MNFEHWASPITTLDGQIVAIELVTRIEIDGVRVIEASQYREQIEAVIRTKAAWLEENSIVCVVKDNRLNLPFVRCLTTETTTAGAWLDEVGAHGNTAVALLMGSYEAVRLNKRYTAENIDRPMFGVLVNNIRKYCNRVIIQTESRKHNGLLAELGVWAVQGQIKPMRFEQCEKLIGK
ncbi:hypothetical protein F3J34_11430 [Klebsiella sp. Ap-873]|nr:hypothetical protein [Klebsiella sp. Ap-873]